MSNSEPKEKEKAARHRCWTCGRTFATYSRLRRHEACHSLDRLYECTTCNHTFKRHDALRRHSKSCSQRGEHEIVSKLKRGPKPRSCDFCRLKKVRCNRAEPCQHCSSSKIRCSYTHVNDVVASSGSDRIITDDDSLRCPTPKTTDSNYFTMVFLLKYTDPAFENITDALAATGAGPEAVVDATKLYQPSVYIVENAVDCIFSEVTSNLSLGHPGETTSPESTVLALPQTSALQHRIEELHDELAMQHKKNPAASPFLTEAFTMEMAKAAFTVENITDFVSAYFDYFHPHFGFLHRSTFDIGSTYLPLLLAVALCGSAHLTPRDDALAARYFFRLGEEYIFGLLHNLVADSSYESDKRIELVQAAQLIHSLQASSNDEKVRRRVRVYRHPELIASMRSLGLIGIRRRQRPEISDWDHFIAEEMRIRLVTGIFVQDCMIMLFLNNPPQMTLSEMSSDLPCSDALFETPTASGFVALAATLKPCTPQVPSLKDLLSLCLQETWPGHDDPRFTLLELKHLLILILALHSMIFVARTACLLTPSYQTLHRAMDRWKELWEAIHKRPKAENSQSIGFAKYSLELWWLGRKLLDLAMHGEVGGEYMKGIPSDSLTALHEFIQAYAG